MLDIPTLITLTGLNSLLLGLGALATAKAYPDQVRGIQRWGASTICEGVGWLLLVNSPILSPFFVAVADVFLLLSLCLSLHALRDLQNAPMWKGLYWLIVPAGLLFWLWSMVWPSYFARNVLLSACICVLALGCVYSLRQWLRQRTTSLYATVMTCSYAMLAVFMALRVGHSLLYPSEVRSILEPHPVNLIFHLGVFFFVVTLTLNYLLICNEQVARKLNHLATTDALTGVWNRRTLEELVSREAAAALRQQTPLCALMIDLDHFKHVNDTYGHQAGDTVLTRVVAALRAELRETDILGRYGGEEFLAVTPATEIGGAFVLAERLRTAVQRTHPVEADPAYHPTLSIGIASLQLHENHENLIDRADAALYEAKVDGRNRVRIAL